MVERIEFDEAITEPLLLKRRFDELSLPQQAILKLIYGVPLSATRRTPDGKFSELDFWRIFHEGADLDELGYPIRLSDSAIIPPYAPRIYREAWLILGRRSGKTDAISSTAVAYESVCGGHESYLRPGQQGICFQIAQDLRLARNSLHFIRAVLESSPLLSREMKRVTADRIDLKNRFSIACVPATTKSVRGFANPIAVMDEVGVWYQESESANPDYEVYRALTPGQIQFPHARVIGISSPWNKAGMLFSYYQAGTGGFKARLQDEREQYQHSLVVRGPTAMMGNPQVQRTFLSRERSRDERAYDREFLANFQDSISGFLPNALIEMAKDPGIFERAPQPGVVYIPAIDPGFKRDSFALTICHREEGKIVQDLVRRFTGTPDAPLSPAFVLDQIEPLLRAYQIHVLYSDQYHFESLQELFRQRNVEIVQIAFTAKSKAQIYGNIQQLLLQRKIRLLDHAETLKELKSLERTLTDGGSVQIAAPRGMHDDVATVLAIAVSQTMWMGDPEPLEEPAKLGVDYKKLIDAQIERKWAAQEVSATWD